MTAAFYPTSWYAASLDENHFWPALDCDVRAHVCVIGGGFTGVSAALRLAEKGFSVVLLEAQRIGWGASGRSGGQMIHGISGQERMEKHWGAGAKGHIRQMAWEGNRIIRWRVSQYGIKCDLQDGWCEAATKPRHMRAMEAQAKIFQAEGTPEDFAMLDQSAMRDKFGTKEYIGGLMNMTDGHLHPLKLVRGEAKAAASLGVRIFEGSKVVRIDKGSPSKVHCAGGTVTADHVIIASGVQHGLEKRKMAGYAYPAASYIMATEPLSADVRERINPDNWAVCDAANVFSYYRYSNDGRLLFGGRCNYSGDKPASVRDILQPRIVKLWPELAGVKISHTWGGKISMSLSHYPLVGRTDDTIWHAYGYSGHGINVSHLVGNLLGDAIAGQMESYDIFAKLPRRRLPVGNMLGRRVVSLRIFWERLKDLL